MLEYSLNGDIITIRLPEEVNSANTKAFGDDLVDVPISEDVRSICLDARDLIYISSAGLRCLLAFKKEHDVEVTIAEVSLEVREILHMTGFDQLFVVEAALRRVDTSGLQELGRGMYGAVYRLNDEQVLKVFHGVSTRKGLEEILDNMRMAFVAGIPTIIPFDTVVTDEGYGMVFELLSSECLADLIHKNPARVEEYAVQMADLARVMASTEFEQGSLQSRNAMLKAELESASYLFTEAENAELMGYVDAVPERNTAVHGDFHARNIYLADEGAVLIDMDDFCLGHPIWDIACLYRVYPYLIGLDASTYQPLFDLPDEVPYEDFYYRIMHVSFEEGSQLWDLFVEHYLEDYTDNEVAVIMETAKVYSDLMVIRFVIDQCRTIEDDPDRLERKLAFIRGILARMRDKDASAGFAIMAR